MTDRIILEEGKIYKIKPPTKLPMMSQSALYQLSRYAYENDLRFGQALLNFFRASEPIIDLCHIENDELERRIKEFINENNSSKQG